MSETLEQAAAEQAEQNKQAPTRGQIIKTLKEQIEIGTLHVKLGRLNADAAINQFQELEAKYNIGKLMSAMQQQVKQPGQPADDKYIEHTVTQEDLDNNPSLEEQGIKLGQQIVIPKEAIVDMNKDRDSENPEVPIERKLKVTKD